MKMASILEANPNETVTIGGMNIRLAALDDVCARIHVQATCLTDGRDGFKRAVQDLATLLGTGCAVDS